MIPKAHHSHISELPEEYAAALGLVVTRVAKALTKGSVTDETFWWYDSLTCAVVLENTGLNVVGNQEYAQAVPHVRVQCSESPAPCNLTFPLKGPLPYHPRPATRRPKKQDGVQSV